MHSFVFCFLKSSPLPTVPQVELFLLCLRVYLSAILHTCHSAPTSVPGVLPLPSNYPCTVRVESKYCASLQGSLGGCDLLSYVSACHFGPTPPSHPRWQPLPPGFGEDTFRFPLQLGQIDPAETHRAVCLYCTVTTISEPGMF